MVKFLIKHPISVAMSLLALIILGIVSTYTIPVSLLPDVDIPEITILASLPEKSVKEVEFNYLHPLRRNLQHVSNLDQINSFAANGHGNIKLLFNYGTNINYAFIEVNEKIDGIMSQMPKDFERPRIIKASVTDIPVFYLYISLKEKIIDPKQEKYMQLSEFSEQIIKKRIEQIPEVAMVDISGMEYPEIVLKVNINKIKNLNISIDDIVYAITNNNLSLGNIRIREGKYEFNVKYSTLVKNRFDLENIFLKSGNRVLKLKDIASIDISPRSGKGLFLNRDKHSIIMAVIKKSNARMSDLKEKTNKEIEAMREEYKRIDFEVARNQTELLDYSINNLKLSLLTGVILIFFVMLIFQKDFKSAFLIGVSVIVSLVISLLFFYLFNISINIISLSGLIVGIGVMIDNSIIVTDNIYQYFERENDLQKACIVGTNEVIRPLLSSALTTCAVFIPLIFLSGISGALFYDQAIAISIGLMVSFLISITFIPVFFNNAYRNNKKNKNKNWLRWFNIFQNIENKYELGFKYVLKNKFWFVCSFAILIILGCLIVLNIKKERFPGFKQKELVIEIDWNKNINVDENKKRITTFFGKIDNLCTQTSAMIGEQYFLLNHINQLGSSQANIYFKLKKNKSLDSLIMDWEGWIRNNHPSAIYKYKKSETIFEKLFRSNEPSVQIRLWNDNNDKLPKPTEIKEFNKIILRETGVKTNNQIPLQEYIEIKPDFEKLLLYNVSVEQLTNTLKKSFNKLQVTSLKQGQYEIPVLMADNFDNINHIIQITKVPSIHNLYIPVSSLISFNRIIDYKIIQASKENPFVALDYDIPSNLFSNFSVVAKKVVKKFPRMQMAFSGSLIQNQKIFGQLAIILIVSLLLLYFILASQFESLMQPLIVFIEIPINIAGALIFLYLTGNSLNIMSFIGIIVMIGIVINDSILKIDTINILVKKNYSLIDAIKLGGKRRLKPIIMTSLTTIFAVLPFLFSNSMGASLQKSFSWALIGGMITGTFISLYFIPLAYYYIYRSHKN